MAPASGPEERLAALGLDLPEVAAPLAAYVPALRHGDLVFTSGQLPMVEGTLAAVGKVGAIVPPEQAKDLAGTCALNALPSTAIESSGRSSQKRLSPSRSSSAALSEDDSCWQRSSWIACQSGCAPVTSPE